MKNTQSYGTSTETGNFGAEGIILVQLDFYDHLPYNKKHKLHNNSFCSGGEKCHLSLSSPENKL